MSIIPPPDPDTAAIAGLSREVQALRRELAEHAELPALVARLCDTVGLVDVQPAVLSARLEKLGNLVARLMQQAQAPPDDAPGAVTWVGFDGDVETAEAILGHLCAWLEGVYLQWPDAARGLPHCWMWHPEIVEELLWLRASWIAAYSPRARSSDVGDWHDRQRPGVVRRIRSYGGSCSIEEHSKPVPAPVVVLEDAASDIAKWWVSDRDKPAPEPTEQQIQAVRDHETSSRR